MSSSKLIRETQAVADAVAWQAPEVLPAVDEEPQIDPEQVRREAFEQGFQQGQSDGFATGAARRGRTAEAEEYRARAAAWSAELDLREGVEAP